MEWNCSELNFLIRNLFRRSDSVYMKQHPATELYSPDAIGISVVSISKNLLQLVLVDLFASHAPN